MPPRKVSVKLDADAGEYTAALRKAAAETRALPDQKTIKIKGDASQWQAALRRMEAESDHSGGESAKKFGTAWSREFRQRKVFFASVVAGALTAGAPLVLAGAAIMFGGIAAVAGAQAQEVRDSWTKLGRDISKGSLEDAKVFIPALQEMASDLGATFEQLRPQIRDAFTAAAPLLDIFTRGVSGLAENAMPGFLHVLQGGMPVMEGFQSFLEKFGTGFTDMLDAMMEHAPAAGAAFSDWGDIFGALLPLLGELLGQGAELAKIVLPPLATVINGVAVVTEKLGAALPGLVLGFVGMKIVGFAATQLKNFAVSAEAATIAASGSAVAGGRVASAFTSASESISRMAVALPILGVVVSGISDTHTKATTQEEKWAEAISKGGKAASDAYKEYKNNTHWGQSIDEAMGLASSWEDAKDAAYTLADSTGKAATGIGAVTVAAADDARKLVDLPGILTSAAGAIALVGSTADMTKDQMDTAAKKVVDFRTELQTIASAFVDPLAAYQGLLQAKSESERKAAEATAKNTVSSSDSWVDYADKTKVTLDEVAAKLQEQITNQQNWRDNIVKIAGWAGVDVANELAKMGKEGVDIVALMADGSSAEAQRMVDLIRQDIQLGGTQWAADLQLATNIMQEKAKEGGRATAQSVADALGAGLADVQRVAGQYSIVLAVGLNPILHSLGQPSVPVSGPTRTDWQKNSIFAPGTPFAPKAQGDVIESHHAQIAPGGAMRIWAEPETGGEAYIPLAPAKRARSLAIWQKTGDLLGAQHFAWGGISDIPKPPSFSPYQAPISTAGDATTGKAYSATAAWFGAALNGLGGPAGAGVQRWMPLVLTALGLVGQPAFLAQTVLRRMNQESGGNPRAINLTDSNAMRGTPSKGLMQVIDPTFRAYAMAGYNRDVYDPMSNLLASMRYAMSRYGSLPAAYNKAGGYANGGATPVGSPFWVGENGPELMWSNREQYVSSAAKSREFAGNGGVATVAASPNVVVNARVFVGNREITDIARVESEAVLVSALTTAVNRGDFNR